MNRTSKIQRRRLAVLGHIRLFREEVAARAALGLAVNARLRLKPGAENSGDVRVIDSVTRGTWSLH